MDKEIKEFQDKISQFLEMIDIEALKLAKNAEINQIVWIEEEDKELNHKLTKQFFGRIMRSRDALQDILRMIDDVTFYDKKMYIEALRNTTC